MIKNAKKITKIVFFVWKNNRKPDKNKIVINSMIIVVNDPINPTETWCTSWFISLINFAELLDLWNK